MKLKDNNLRNSLKILFWGSYDLEKPRVNLLLKGAQLEKFSIIEQHKNVWSGVSDKSQIRSWKKKIKIFFSWIFAYPSLIKEFISLDSSQYDVILVPYFGLLDVLILYPFARIKKKPIVWDVFISMYDTVVKDRQLLPEGSLRAKIIYALEWLATRAANYMFLDTKNHMEYFSKLYNIPLKKLGYVFVGAEVDKFYPINVTVPRSPFKVLFYGQFIPLHGIETIVLAAKKLENKDIEIILIGRGQESEKIDYLIESLNLSNVKRIPWVPYNDLVKYINGVHLCLGIFGISEKSRRVIPNKIYQVLACKKPVVTADTPAIEELVDFLKFDYPLLFLVPPNDPISLANKILEIKDNYTKILSDIEKLNFSPIDATVVGKQLKKCLSIFRYEIL